MNRIQGLREEEEEQHREAGERKDQQQGNRDGVTKGQPEQCATQTFVHTHQQPPKHRYNHTERWT